MKKNIFLLSALTVMVLLNSCKKDPAPINEEEVITTVILSLQKDGSTTVQNFVFNDPDGDGGLSATTDSIIIEKAAIYNATITLLNNLVSPADTISKEVLEEGLDHQLFYQSTPGNVLSGFTYEGENDTDGNPIGLNFSFATWNTGGAGSLKITLRHMPAKSATGVASGDITNAAGETDVEVDFPIRLF
jgi:hypothetical protein